MTDYDKCVVIYQTTCRLFTQLDGISNVYDIVSVYCHFVKFQCKIMKRSIEKSKCGIRHLLSFVTLTNSGMPSMISVVCG